MDPALWELLRSSVDGDDQEVEAIIRLNDPRMAVDDVHVVSRFGGIATCRLRRSAILRVRGDENVLSLKAARALGPERWLASGNSAVELLPFRVDRDIRRPPNVGATGARVCVGIIDWGCDFDHPNFKRHDGSTRLLALWDQRGLAAPGSPIPYGYGVVYSSVQIDDAFRSQDPYDALGYHPADADRDGSGAHGTFVMDIAAGNGRAGGPVGVAPDADLIFVHLADRGTTGLANLGDSVRILEAVDFIARTAGRRPWVINLSVGRHGGPHDGATLAELAFDYVLRSAPGRFIVQSTGNYFDKTCHASGRLGPGQAHALTVITDEADVTPNELEVWYSGQDEFVVQIESPTGRRSLPIRLGEQRDVLEEGRIVGRLYHRDFDPNNCDHHIELFLYPWAPAGSWVVTLQALRARNGTFHAWLERDEFCATCQAHFPRSEADNLSTTGTIANGHLPLVVGAYNAHSFAREIAPFSSAGPTRDGRLKPEVAAPGIDVLAAQSAPLGSTGSPGMLTRKSGTSFAAPHVTGAVALCLQGAPRPLSSAEIRTLLLDSAEPVGSNGFGSRFGNGYLDISRVVAAVSTLDSREPSRSIYRSIRTKPRHSKEPEMQPDLAHTVRDSVGPDRLYRELVYRREGPLCAWIDEAFLVLARPGETPIEPPEVGDLLVRVALGEPNLGDLAVLSGSALLSPGALAGTDVRSERAGPGLYATVVECRVFPRTYTDLYARRVLNEAGRMPLGQVLLRPRLASGGDQSGVELDPDFAERWRVEPPSVTTDEEGDGGLEYEEILTRIRQELALPFKDPDDPGLAQRRRRLRALFGNVPRLRTKELHLRLGQRPTGDELSTLFHGRLARATRRELLKVLESRFPDKEPTPPPAPVSPRAPLPLEAEERFRGALTALKQKVVATTDTRAWRYRCWLSKLEAGADDRVIEWRRICPSTSGATGAAIIVGPCDITGGLPVDQTELEAAIRSVQDVEQANKRLNFITHMRSEILFTHEMTSENVHLENFRRFHDEVNRTINNLRVWANSPIPLDRPSAAMPRAHVAIKDWISDRQRDTASVYSCM
jgi:subtilisin family serine protease